MIVVIVKIVTIIITTIMAMTRQLEFTMTPKHGLLLLEVQALLNTLLLLHRRAYNSLSSKTKMMTMKNVTWKINCNTKTIKQVVKVSFITLFFMLHANSKRAINRLNKWVDFNSLTSNNEQKSDRFHILMKIYFL